MALWVSMAAAAVAFAAAAVLFARQRRLSRCMEEVLRASLSFCDGDLSCRIREDGPEGVARLARALNVMASDLSARMERLKQLEDMRREFVANVSHELKTPVTSIRGFAETLRDGAEADPKLARQYLDIIAAQAGRLSSIIEDLLQLSRIEQEMQGGAPMEVSPAPVLPILESVAGMLSSSAHERNMTIAISCDEALVACINPHLVEQAVANLVDNAVKYGSDGMRVDVAAFSDGNSVTIEVRDEGPGIPAEHLPRIFERFYRVDKGRSRKMGGTGLGLAIVKHIAGLHGGTVSVESEAGAGSRFKLTLPV